jgi:hypothetical protein
MSKEELDGIALICGVVGFWVVIAIMVWKG